MSFFPYWLWDFLVLNRINDTFSEETGMFRGGHSKFIVEAMMPYFSHIVPIIDDTMFNGIFEIEYTFFGDCFFTYICVLAIHADHNAIVFWSAYDWREGGTGGVITWETGFAHTWTVVDDYGRGLFLFRTHFNKITIYVSSTHRIYCNN